MPATSEARLRANQQNATKSTGPKTPEGKQRSRRNGLKHGLTGRGVVLAPEDAPEVQRRSDALMAELDPKSELGAILVGDLATLSVRMERGARHEEEALASRVRHAPEAFDRGRVEWAATLFEALMRAEDPRAVLAEMHTSPEGIDRLRVAWLDARFELTHPTRGGWSILNLPRVAALAGLRPADAERSRLGALRGAILGDFAGLGPAEGGDLDADGRRRWAVDRLVEWVDAEVARLGAIGATLDLATIARDRAGAAELAWFDPSAEAARARRYEAEARRGFYRALREFRRVESEVVDSEEVGATEAVSGPGEGEASLGSCWETPGEVRPEARPSRREAVRGLARAVEGAEAVARGLDGRVVAIGRATFGGG